MKAILAVLLLAGCVVTPEERAQYRENLAVHCSGFGFVRGTIEHAHCMERTHLQARQNQTVRNQAAMHAGRQITGSQADALDAYAIPQRNTGPLRAPSNTHCRPDGLGGMTCTQY
jgi:sRNA-binding protein